MTKTEEFRQLLEIGRMPENKVLFHPKFILSGGCEITPETPAHNLHTLREASIFNWK